MKLRRLKPALFIDLLDPEIELSLSRSPVKFWEELQALNKGGLVIIDEVQRVPVLLDYVQKGIEEIGLRFVLSGSSARKLKHRGSNLLAGRALHYHMYPLISFELGKDFSLEHSLRFGQLPSVYSEKNPQKYLESYVKTYLEQEIRQEGLTRNLAAFSRFLEIGRAHV